MDDATATLLLTRPDPQSLAFLAECEALAGRRLAVVVSPLLEIEPIGELPALDDFSTVILTSGNGARRMAGALARRKVVTVGEATAALAQSYGAEAVSLGESMSEFLSNTAGIESPALYCRGVYSRGDLTVGLGLKDLIVQEAVLYDQVFRPLTKAAQALLVGQAPVVAPVFSPRTAELLSKFVITAPLTLVAMSKAVGDTWPVASQVKVAKTQTSAAMCAGVIEAI